MKNLENKKHIFTFVLNILFYALLFFIFLANSLNYLDPDLGWHLKAGEEISITHNVPWAENYNYTLTGKTWVDHEWFLNLVSFQIYSKFGYIALNIFFSLVGLLIMLLINKYFLKRLIVDHLHFVFFLVLEMTGLIGVLSHFGVRMQMFSVLMFLIQLILIENYGVSKNRKILYLLPAVFFLWANLHGGFMLGLLVYWSYFGFSLLFPFLAKRFAIFHISYQKFSKKEQTALTWSLIMSSLAVFITPYHYKYFTFMLEYSNTFYMKTINEWLPAWYAPINYYQQAFLIIFVITIIIFFINRTKRELNGWHLLLGLLLFVAAIKARRNFPLFFIASIPLLASTSTNINKAKFPKAYDYLFNNKYLRVVLVFSFVFAIFLVSLCCNFTNKPFQNQKFCNSYPCTALREIEKLPQENLKIFNVYGWGGYLIWSWPSHKLFIDGRLPMLEVNGHSLLEEYYAFYSKDNIAEKLDIYDINLVLLQKFHSQKFNWFEKTFLFMEDKETEENPIQEYLRIQQDWELVFEDERSFVYYKK